MDSEIEQLAGDILRDPRFLQLMQFSHHGADNSVYDHSLAVARVAHRFARLMRLSGDETASVVRAALLHDFFGYDWHGDRFRRYLSRYSGWQRFRRMHAFVHGPLAASRARQAFGLTERECDAIACHMFPLAALPRTRLAWIITLADKAVASREMTAALGGYLSLAYRKLFA